MHAEEEVGDDFEAFDVKIVDLGYVDGFGVLIIEIYHEFFDYIGFRLCVCVRGIFGDNFFFADILIVMMSC